MKEENIEKSLLVCTEVTNVTMPTARKAGSLTITFNYPHYLKNSQKESERLLKLLLVGMTSFKVPVRGLELKWFENVKDAEGIE